MPPELPRDVPPHRYALRWALQLAIVCTPPCYYLLARWAEARWASSPAGPRRSRERGRPDPRAGLCPWGRWGVRGVVGRHAQQRGALLAGSSSPTAYLGTGSRRAPSAHWRRRRGHPRRQFVDDRVPAGARRGVAL